MIDSLSRKGQGVLDKSVSGDSHGVVSMPVQARQTPEWLILYVIINMYVGPKNALLTNELALDNFIHTYQKCLFSNRSHRPLFCGLLFGKMEAPCIVQRGLSLEHV